MKNKLILILLLALPYSGSYAALDDIQLTWTITPVTFGYTSYDKLELDLELGPRYVRAVGALKVTRTNRLAPVTGTCFGTAEGVYCLLQTDQATIGLNINGATINGDYVVKNASGDEVYSGLATFFDLK